MKKVIALALAILLVLGLVVLPASAEAVKEDNVAEDVVLSVGTDEIVKADGAPIEEYGAGEVEKADGAPIEEYGEEEIIKAEGEPIQEYGFWGWLKNLWKSVLKFFGL